MLIAYALFGLWYRPIDGGLFSESAVAESPGLCCWGGRYGRSFDCASCIKPQDASLRMTVLGWFHSSTKAVRCFVRDDGFVVVSSSTRCW